MVNLALVEITLNDIENDPLFSFQPFNWSLDAANHYHHGWTKIAKNVMNGFNFSFNEHQIDKITCPLIDYGKIISEALYDIDLITSPNILFIINHIITEIETRGWSYKMFDNRHTEIITFSIER